MITSYRKLILCFASKKANFASKPRHHSTVDRWKYGDGQVPSKIKISSWNVNGVRSVIRKGKLQQYISIFNPDIFCINETKIDLEAYLKQEKLFNCLNNYYQYWNFCKVSSGYSGVAIFSKYKPINASQDFQCGYLSLEGRCLTLEFKNFFLLNCYKPNSGSQLERLKQRTQQYDPLFLKNAIQLKTKKTLIMVGDMNVAHKEIDLANPHQNRNNAGFTDQQRLGFEMIIQNRFIDTYRHLYPHNIQYTWWSNRARSREKNAGWRIDYILTSNPNSLCESVISDEFEGSDHCPIHAQFKI